jgi:hypothetical protein
MELRIATAVVGIILLIACINVGNLLLARGTTRQREIAVRLAIGAGRWRIIRQLLTESMLLAVLGGCFGLLLAWCGGQLLSALISGAATSVTPDVRVLGFTGAVSLLTGIGFGLLPAMHATRTNLTPSLKASGSGSGGSLFGAAGSRPGLGKGLVISQIGLCLTLLIGAGLLLQSLRKLSQADVGFEREKVLLMWVLPTMVGYDIAQENSLYGQLLPRLNVLPGVQPFSIATFQRVLGTLRFGSSTRVWHRGGCPRFLQHHCAKILCNHGDSLVVRPGLHPRGYHHRCQGRHCQREYGSALFSGRESRWQAFSFYRRRRH